MFELNPIDVLRKREIGFMPPHFSKIKLSDDDSLFDEKSDWIKNKLKGRYYINHAPSIDNNKLKTTTFIGFEDPKELTYFMLACPFLRRS